MSRLQYNAIEAAVSCLCAPCPQIPNPPGTVTPMDRQVVVGVAIVADGRVLAALRPGAEGGWEFPGGKVEPGESDQAAAVREIEEELGVRITVGQPLEGEQPIGDKYVLRVYLAELAGHDWSPTLREHAEIRWVHAADLRTLNWLPADQPFLATLRDRLVAAE